MVVSIHQPDYIPWLGFFYKMSRSDVFVYLDDAQYSNEAAHNFNVIKTANGEFRLKFPVAYKFGDKINEVRPKDELKWKEKHLKTIELNYKKAPFFQQIFPRFQEVLTAEYANVAELNIAVNNFIAQGFGILPEKVLRSSEMGIDTVREERVIDITVACGGDEYLSGNGARVYQTESHFTDRGVKLTYLDYKPISYCQCWKEFLPCMSALDYIFNCGWDWDYVKNAVKELNNGDR